MTRVQDEMATKITVDTLGPVKSYKALTGAVRSSISALKSQDIQLKSSGQYMEAAKAKVKGLANVLDLQKSKLAELIERQKGLDKTTVEGQREYSKLEGQIQSTNRQISNYSAQLERAKNTQKYYTNGLAGLQHGYKQATDNSKSYIAQLKAEGKQHQAAREEYKLLNNTIGNLSKQYKIQRQVVRDAQSEYDRINDAIKEQENKMKSLSNVVGKGGAEYGRAATELKRLKGSLNNANDSLSKEKIRLNESGTALATNRTKTKELSKSYSNLSDRAAITADRLDKGKKAMASGWSKIKSGVQVASVAVAGLGAVSLAGAKKAGELQNSYKQVENLLVTGGEKTSAAIKNVNQMQADGAKYSVQYGKSQQSIADGYEDLVKRGYSSEQALGSMRSELQASVASGDEFQDVVKVSSQTLESFGLRSKSTAGMIKNTKTVTNQLAYAADATSTGFSDLGIGMSYVGTSAHQAGFSLAETASAMGILSNNGLEADKAGTGLRKAINSLVKPTNNGTAALKEIGLSTKDFVDKSGKMKSMTDIFGLLSQHTDSMSGHEKGVLFNTLFGTTGQQAGAILTSNAKELGELNKKVAESQSQNKGQGYVERLANKNMKSVKAEFAQFKQAANASMILIGKAMLPALDEASTALVKTFNNPKTQKGLTSIAEGIGEVTKDTVEFTSFIGNHIETVGAFGKVVAAIWATGKIVKFTSMAKEAIGLLSNESSILNSHVSTSSSLGKVNSSASKSFSISKGLSYAAVATNFGMQASKSFKEGINTKKGGADMWNAAGQGVGGAIGAALGGPVGAAAGTAVGGIIGDVFAKSIQRATILDKKQGSKKVNQTKREVSRFTGEGRISNSTVNATSRLYGLDTNHNNSKSSDKRKNPYKLLPKNMTDAMKSVEKTFDKTNSNIVANGGRMSKKVGKQNASTLQNMSRQLKTYSKGAESNNKKELDYLVKKGSISKKTEQKILKNTKSSDKKRVKSAEDAINNIAKKEAKGQKVSTKEIKDAQKKIAAVISSSGSKRVSSTQKMANREKIIYGKLKDSTTKLSAKQGEAIVKRSYKTMRSEISYADKTYNSKKKSAEKQYRKTKATLDDEYYVKHNINKKQYQDAVSKAKKTRDETVEKAEDQKTKIVKSAEDQHGKVVKEASKQSKTQISKAGETVTSLQKIWNGFKKFWSDFWGSLTKLGSQGARAMASNITPSLTNNNKFLNNLSSGKGGKSKPASNRSSGKIKINTGFATGGEVKFTQTTLVGEGGKELAYNDKTGQYRFLGENGPAFQRVFAGEHILNAKDTQKALHGGIGRGKVLKGYASGTDTLKGFSSLPLVGSFSSNRKKHKKDEEDEAKNYEKLRKSSTKSLQLMEKSHKKQWNNIYKNSTTKAKSIKKKVSTNFNDLTDDSIKSLKSLNNNSSKIWKDTLKDSNSYTYKIKKNASNNYDELRDHFKKNNHIVNSDWNKSWTNITRDFNEIFAKMKPYAHSGMSGAIGQINGGITSINSALGQFGSKGDIIKAVHYAQGTDGPLKQDTLAILNDAKVGPKQEAIFTQEGKVYAPRGEDVVTHLRKGDQVLSGGEVQLAQKEGILPHFAKGTGKALESLRKQLDSNSAKPGKIWNRNFESKIKSSGSDLRKGLTNLNHKAVDKVGPEWNSEIWKQMAATMNASGAGGNWLHNPGLVKTNGFGASRSFGTHDGVDFGGPLGSSILAVHGGTVTRTGDSNPWNSSDLGYIITVKSDDGYQEIYQEFGGKNNIKVKAGDQIKTGQKIATLGNLIGAGSGAHVHIGVSKGSLWNHGGSSTKGWLDVTKMNGSSSGSNENKTTSVLSKLVKSQLKSTGITSWISKNLTPLVEKENGSLGSIGAFSGSLVAMIKKAAEEMHAKIPGGNYMKYLLAMIKNESGGKAGITGIDDGDGTGAAMGLLQYKRGTFNTYAVKGHKNILNAYDQLLAFFNNSNYKTDIGIGYNGKWGEWRGNASGPSGHRRFANGGITSQHQMAEIAEGGKTEAIVPWDVSKRSRAYTLLVETMNEFGKTDAPKEKKKATSNQLSKIDLSKIESKLDTLINLMMQLVGVNGEQLKSLQGSKGDLSNLYKQIGSDKALFDFQRF